MMHFRPEVLPFIGVSFLIGLIVALVARMCRAGWRKAARAGAVIAVVLSAYMLYFFRDPPRTAPADPALVVAGADGTVMAVTEVDEKDLLKTRCVRISIFLSLFDVHVNRAPIAGTVSFLNYYPGARYFTFQEKSSDLNQHSAIFIEGRDTRCVVYQIVGPVARRVVYWLTVGQSLDKGESIGMMKFGSRLDMYFPKDDVEVVVQKGQKVRAGETVVARIKSRVTP